jgi:hypothetical protein
MNSEILQNSWTDFCIQKSLNNTEINVISLVENMIKSENNEDSIFQDRRPLEFIKFLKNKDLLSEIAINVAHSIDFKFFNASLLYACCLEDTESAEDLVIEEQDFDTYNPEAEENFLLAMRNANLIAIIRACTKSKSIKKTKKIIDNISTNLPKNIYDRIWNRAIEFESELLGY